MVEAPLGGVSNHLLENDKVQMAFSELDGNVWLSTFKEKGGQQDHIAKVNRTSNLWRIELRDDNGDAKNINAGGKVSFSRSNQTMRITWDDVPAGDGSASVVVTVTLPNGATRALWDIRAELKGAESSLEKLVFSVSCQYSGWRESRDSMPVLAS